MESLFFNEEIQPKKKEVVVEDFTGFLSIVYEAEDSWNNIERATLHEEYLAVLNEDKEGAMQTAKDTFKKLITMFTNLAKAFASAATGLVNRIMVNFTKGEKFINANSSRLDGANLSKAKDVTIYGWKATTIGAISASISNIPTSSIQSAINSGTEMSKDQVAASIKPGSTFTTLDKVIIGNARNDKKASSKVTSEMVNNAKNSIKSLKKSVGDIKKACNSADKLIKDGLKAAKDGANGGDKKKKINATKTARAGYSAVSKILNVGIKLVMEKYRDDMVILRAAMSTSSKKKADKKDNKEEKVENASLDLFSLDGYSDMDDSNVTLESLLSELEDDEIVNEDIETEEDELDLL